MNTKLFQINMKEETLNKMKEFKTQTGISMSAQVRLALLKFFGEEK